MSAEQPSSQQTDSGPSGAGHGSLSDEALRLAETVQTWLSSGAVMAGAGTSSECKVCPLCQLIGLVGKIRPEVMAHLVEAGSALAAAAKAAADSSERAWTAEKRPPVQHIHVT